MHLKNESVRSPGRLPFEYGMRSQAKQLVSLSQLLDALIIAVVFALVWNPDFSRSQAEFIAVLLLVPFWTSLFRFYGLYESHRLERFTTLARRLLSGQATGSLLLLLIMSTVSEARILPRLAAFLVLSTAVMLSERWLLYTLLYSIRRRGFDQRVVCIIGSWQTAQSIGEEFSQHPEWGLHIGCVAVGALSERQFLHYPSGGVLTPDLQDVLKKEVIDELLIALPAEQVAKEKAVMSLCEQYGLVVRILPFPLDLELEAADIEDFCGKISIAMGGLQHNGVAVAVKAVLDILLASLMLVFLSPVMGVAALLVKLSSRGPIIFSQTRVGLRGRHFKMYKFRTMIDDAETMAHSVAHRRISKGPIFKARDDWRITPIGWVLRKSSIDELPQLFNVLKGDMSLVGPRPLPRREAEAISGSHRKRFSMRPGITCLWQVNGRSELDYAAWVKYDLQYVNNWSLWLDVKLLLQTIPAVLSGRGAY